MRNILIVLICLVSATANAQLTKPVSRIQLYSGDVIKGEHVIYESLALKSAYFTVDNEQYETSTIEYIQNNHGFMANLGRIHGFEKERYALRIRTGKMNLFEEIDIDVYGGEELKTESKNNPQDPMLASGEMYQYYSKGEGHVMEASYTNLKIDLADNEKSMKHLKSFRNFRALQWGLLGVGSGLIAASVIKQSGGPVKFNPVMALGIVIGGGSYFMENAKEDALWLAADEYNKPEAEVLSEK